MTSAAPMESTTQREHASLHSDLSELIGRLAYVIDRVLSPGDLAALRRLDPHDPSTAAFWRLCASHLSPAGQLPDAEPRREVAERRWAAVFCAMAHLAGLHAAGRPLGTALADVGFSELRFARLLRASDDALLRLAIEAARFLASKARPSNQVDLALLVLSDGWTDTGARERVRRQIARRYYGAASE